MSNNESPIICALDTADMDRAIALSRAVLDKVAMLKLGLEFFTANGISGVRKIMDMGMPVFLDLKLHDIPNTVAGAISAIKDLNVSMLTVHINGGRALLLRAMEELRGSATLLVGVTMLTSMNGDDLRDVGISCTMDSHVMKLVDLAVDVGLQAIVCSPHEVSSVRKKHSGVKIVVPGIRISQGVADDQKRVKTPKEALLDGADYLVIGRPITRSEDPAGAVEEILSSIR